MARVGLSILNKLISIPKEYRFCPNEGRTGTKKQDGPVYYIILAAVFTVEDAP